MAGKDIQTIALKDKFFGREEILKEIDKVLNEINTLKIFNIEGEGGIGKTSLLRQVKLKYDEDISKSSLNNKTPKTFFNYLFSSFNSLINNNNVNIEVSKIIDFYDISFHTELGFLDRIIDSLNENTHHKFDNYRQSINKYEELRYAGITGETLSESYQNAIREFQYCFNSITENSKRICLLIDTFELVQNIMNDFLPNLFKGLINTVIIVAGRKNMVWNKQLINILGKEIVIPHKLKEFNLNETIQFFANTERGLSISKDSMIKLQFLSNGKPILLSMILDWKSIKLEQIDQFLNPINDYAIDELDELSKTEICAFRNNFEKELSLQFFDDIPDSGRALFYMSIAYKHFDAEILSYLDGIPLKEAKEILKKIENLPYVKNDANSNAYQLHDLLRELIIKYAYEKVDPTKLQKKSICTRLSFYYEGLIKTVSEDEERVIFKQKKAKETENRSAVSLAQRDLIFLKRRKQMLRAHQIYYLIIGDVNSGLKLFRSLFIFNLWNWELQANEILKNEREEALSSIEGLYQNNELILEAQPVNKFLAEGIDIDTFGYEYFKWEEMILRAKENIKIKGNPKKGLIILDKVQHKIKRKQRRAVPFLFADIHLYKGLAYNIESKYKEMENCHRKAISILKKFEPELKEQKFDLIKDIDSIRVLRSLARAYMDLAYGYIQEGKMTQALIEYEKALPYCKKGNMKTELGFIYNDMAFAYARLGQFQDAKLYWETGIDIRNEMLSDYLIGLSLNNGGMLKYLADEPKDGLKFCKDALSIFQRIENYRGIGLSKRALGGILVRIAEKDKQGELLDEAETHLKEAINLFRPGGVAPEQYLYAETLLRMAYLFKARYNLSRTRSDPNAGTYFQKAVMYFEECIDIYRNEKTRIPHAMVLGKMCGLYILSDDVKTAEEYLLKMGHVLSGLLSELKLDLKNILSDMDRLSERNKELIYPIGIYERRNAQIAFNHFLLEEATKSEEAINFLKKAAKHYSQSSILLLNYSIAAYETQNISKEFLFIFRQIQDKEKKIFLNTAKSILETSDKNSRNTVIKWFNHAEKLKLEINNA